MRLREHLERELQRRRHKNPRYSMRSFARYLGLHHSSLSRLIAARSAASETTVRQVGQRLGLSEVDISVLAAAEVEHNVLRAIARPGFHPTSRHLATITGATIDAVNIALQALLRAGALRMQSPTDWSLARQTR
jgi:hypothetical protein